MNQETEIRNRIVRCLDCIDGPVLCCAILYLPRLRGLGEGIDAAVVVVVVATSMGVVVVAAAASGFSSSFGMTVGGLTTIGGAMAMAAAAAGGIFFSLVVALGGGLTTLAMTLTLTGAAGKTGAANAGLGAVSVAANVDAVLS